MSLALRLRRRVRLFFLLGRSFRPEQDLVPLLPLARPSPALCTLAARSVPPSFPDRSSDPVEPLGRVLRGRERTARTLPWSRCRLRCRPCRWPRLQRLRRRRFLSDRLFRLPPRPRPSLRLPQNPTCVSVLKPSTTWIGHENNDGKATAWLP